MPDRYKTIKRLTNEDGIPYKSNPIYPDIPVDENDTYLIATSGDRYDILAQEYYGDSSLWWIISTANSSNNRASLIPTPGAQIRVPFDKDSVINLYNSLNKRR